MKNKNWWVRMFVISSILMCCWLPIVRAVIDIDVEMRLNNGGFTSFDHFKAEFYMNNLGAMTPGATIFGILEVLGEFFFWPSFTTEVDFEIHDIDLDESYIVFLEFDFPDIDEFIPFGPMVFWGAWFLDMETWSYDFQEFWLASAHKWTPTPLPTVTPTPTPSPPLPSFAYIPPGTYTRGSPEDEPCRLSEEGPQHQVTLTRGFHMMTTEVTRQMWADLKAVQPTLPGDPSNENYCRTMEHPGHRFTCYEAILFANLMSLQDGYTRCYYKDEGFTTPVDATNHDIDNEFYCDFSADGYRLPTEAEWEYAARAGTTGPFSADEPNYSSANCDTCSPSSPLDALDSIAWWCGNSEDEAHPVGTRLPNPWGLYDMHGNVFEWCWDWYADYPSGPVTDPRGPSTGLFRVQRGGAWDNIAYGCRSAFRNGGYPDFRYYYQGFRLLRTAN